jgi:PAS domain S-box-containing protein
MSPKRFTSEISSSDLLLHLFDTLPQAYFYLKTTKSEFVKVNTALCRMMGVESDRELLGKTDRDFYAPELAEKYIAEDRLILRTRRPLENQIWLVPAANGILKWYVSTKVPVFGKGGKIIGIAGVMRDFELAGAVLDPYDKLAPVLRHINEKYASAITIKSLARLIHLSVSQFERKFSAIFHLTPMQYIMRVRINAASNALTTSSASMAQIAGDCGFYDQSHFTRQFRAIMQMTPRAYRRRFALS